MLPRLALAEVLAGVAGEPERPAADDGVGAERRVGGGRDGRPAAAVRRRRDGRDRLRRRLAPGAGGPAAAAGVAADRAGAATAADRRPEPQRARGGAARDVPADADAVAHDGVRVADPEPLGTHEPAVVADRGERRQVGEAVRGAATATGGDRPAGAHPPSVRVEAQDRGAGPATRDEAGPAPVQRGTARGAPRGAGRDGQRQRDERPRPRAAAVATATPRRHLHRPGDRAVADLRREGPRVAHPGAGERRARLASRADRRAVPGDGARPGDGRDRPRAAQRRLERDADAAVAPRLEGHADARGARRDVGGQPAAGEDRRARRARRREGGGRGGGDDEGGDAPGDAHGRRLPGGRPRYASTDLTAAAIRSSLGIAASSRFLAYGSGTSAMPTRSTGASRSSKQALETRAAISAVTP